MFAGYRAAEEGASPLGAKVAMEEHSIRIRPIFYALVLSLHSADTQDQTRHLSVQCLNT